MRVSPWTCTAALARAARSYATTSSTALSSLHPRTVSQIRSTTSTRCLAQIRQFSHTRRLLEEQKDKVDGEITQFSQLAEKEMVHENIVKSLTGGMRLSNMTEIQSATIKTALAGTDVVAQAKTGTGKTLAFLIPVLQRMIEADPNLARPSYRPPRTTADDIRGIIISPTRELAEQIAEEARKVVKGTSIVVQAAVGGTQKSMMLRQMQRQGCHLLVGTPGRLSDIFSDEYSGVAAPNLKALVMDEADRLLDQGFWPDIQAFMKLIPDRAEVDRQTLMFSATIPKEVVSIVRQTLKRGFQFVRTMGGEQDVPTTDRVEQKIAILRGYENQIPALIELTQREMAAHKADPANKRPFKAIVYFRSTAEVALARSILSNLSSGGSTERDAFGTVQRGGNHPLRPVRIFHIHSKLTQAARTRSAEAFRTAQSAILLSSDVTARGLDFPDVTHVIQISGPQDRESYIHRIGRTARAGKEGEGWIFVTDSEVNDVDRMLRKIPIKEDNSLACATADMSAAADAEPTSPLAMALQGGKAAPRAEKNLVYNVILASGMQRAVNKRDHVASVNALAANAWGMTEPPAVSAQRAQKLGLARLPGLNLVDQRDMEDEQPERGGSRFGREGGRFGSSSGGGFGRRNDFGSRNDSGGRFGRDSGRRERGSFGRERRSRDADSLF